MSADYYSPYFQAVRVYRLAEAFWRVQQAKEDLMTKAVEVMATMGGAVAPTVAAVSPNSGSAASATTVTITGTCLPETTRVYLEDSITSEVVEASISDVDGDDAVVAVVPARAAGSAWVRVVTPFGDTGDNHDTNALFTWS